MKWRLLLLVLLPGLPLAAQVTVRRPAPVVAVGHYRKLFLGVENELEISTGDRGPMKAYCDNGAIRWKAKEKKYVVIPRDTGPLVITLKGKGYKEEFLFHVVYGPEPEVMVLAPRNDDSAIEDFKASTGIYVGIPGISSEIELKVDSFDIQLIDSVRTLRHRNAGGAWDATTRQLLQAMQPKTRIIISRIVVFAASGRRQRLYKYLEHWYWQ